MADEVEKSEEDMNWDDLLAEYEPEAEEQENKMDEAVAKLTANQRKLAERQQRMEAQNEREKLINAFYEKANEDAKAFADVFLAGVVEPEKVKKMLELAQAKAHALAPADTEDSSEEEDVEKAFSNPVESANAQPRDPAKERAERTRKGDIHAAFQEYMSFPATGGVPRPPK